MRTSLLSHRKGLQRAAVVLLVFGLGVASAFAVLKYKTSTEGLGEEQQNPGQEQNVQPILLNRPRQLTSTSVSLSWTRYPGGNFTRYEVYMGNSSGFPIEQSNFVAAIERQGTTNYVISNLETNKTYYFRLRVVATNGTSVSNEVSITLSSNPIQFGCPCIGAIVAVIAIVFVLVRLRRRSLIRIL